MSIYVKCACGNLLSAPENLAGPYLECPICGKKVEIPHGPSTEGASPELESRGPSAAPQPTVVASSGNKTEIWRRMFESLLDPRSIQWMLMIGGGLCVLGLIVWLVSLGVFEDPLVLATALGLGTFAILGLGWFIALRTRFRVAGQALTFLGCVVAPLNLWFYQAQNLVTVDKHLWVCGVICCLIYGATVFVLRDPLFMYACEAGVTLTVLLLLADLGKITDATWLSLFFMALAFISIHAERAFSSAENSEFPRHRFGLPLFWSGHVQIAASLIILLGSQLLSWFVVPARDLLGIEWAGNLLTDNYLLAAGVWLAGMYAYIYSDLVVRKVGVYLLLAGVCLALAEVTLLLGFDLQAEWIIGALAVTSVAVNVVHRQLPEDYKRVDRFVPPLGWMLGIVPVLWGIVLHIRATSSLAMEIEWAYATGSAFVVVMLIAAVANRINAYLCRHVDSKSSAVYLFSSAASVLVAAAGLLRTLGLTAWSDQAPWLMLIPIGYLIGSRMWKGHSSERPLYLVAHVATIVILAHVFAATLENLHAFAPMAGQTASLMLGLVFAEASLFYLIAELLRGRSTNIYFAAAAACGALWQFMGYYGIDERYYTMLYAVLGVVCLAVSRLLGIEEVESSLENRAHTLLTRGRGRPAYQSGNGILCIACLAAFMQGFAGLAARSGDWLDVFSLLLTTGVAALAIAVVPSASWRRFYAAAAVALGAMTFLRMNLLLDLSGWQKLEIFCVIVGLCMLTASYFGLFREMRGQRSEAVGLGLGFGSILAAVPLVIAVLYHRWHVGVPSLYDEMALLAVTSLMLVTGLSWQVKATTIWGGGALSLYLIVLVASLAYHPQVAIGVYMAVGGALVFAAGIALSVYRDRLLQLPERVANRQGVFRILSWR